MSGWSWSLGATRMPATEASEAPMAQLRVESRLGRPPKRPIRLRLSTTAAHGDAGAGPEQEQAETDGDGEGGGDGDDLLPDR